MLTDSNIRNLYGFTIINIIEVLHLGVASIPKLPREMSFRSFFFRPTHPGKKRRTAADTCRQSKTIKILATNKDGLLQL